MEPSEEIKIKIFQNQKEVTIKPELKAELESIYKKKLEEKWKEEQRLFEKNLPQDRIMTLQEKIHRLLPHSSPLPQTLLRFVAFDDDYNCLMKFLSHCEKIKRITADWSPREINFNHDLFIKLSKKHLKVSRAINKHAERHDDDSHNVVKKILEQTYMISHITLLIHEAKNIAKKGGFKFTEELEDELKQGLRDRDTYGHFKDYIDHCKEALRIKENTPADLDAHRAISDRIKYTLFPLFHFYFPKIEDKKSHVLELARELLKIVENPQPRSYLSYIW